MSIIKINKMVVKIKMHLKLLFPSQLQKYLTLATETEEKIKKKRSKKDHNHLIVNQDLSQLPALKQPQMQKDKA
jgi:hypothetical protein